MENLIELLGVDKADISNIHWNESDYVRKLIPKKSTGKGRILLIPNAQLKALQRKILRNFLYRKTRLRERRRFFSYIRRQPISECAKEHLDLHRGNPFYLIKLDIKSYFDSITPKQAETALEKVLIGEDKKFIPEILKCSFLGTSDGALKRLPTGSPISPFISNIVGHFYIDSVIADFLPKGLVYTRYSDDLYISIPKKIGLTYDKFELIRNISSLLSDNGFPPNDKKIGIYSPANHQKILGITVNSGRMTISYKERSETFFFCRLIVDYGFEKAVMHWNMKNANHEPLDAGGLYFKLNGKLAWYYSVMEGNLRVIQYQKNLQDSYEKYIQRGTI